MNGLSGERTKFAEAEAFRARPNRLTTPRLELVPLTFDEFALCLSDGVAFAEALRLAEPPSEPDAETGAALNWLFDEALALDAASYCWATLWTAILRDENRVVGFCCFKGPPRPFGEFWATVSEFKAVDSVLFADFAVDSTGILNVVPTNVGAPLDGAKNGADNGAGNGARNGAEAPRFGDASTAVVEIGYGVDEAFRGRGLASEALGALLEWGREREDVGFFLAETLTANLPSRRVLEKNGFQRFAASSDALFWRADVAE